MRLVTTELFLFMPVVRNKWWYGFKPVKEEVQVCLTSPYSPTSSTDHNLIQGDGGYSSAALCVCDWSVQHNSILNYYI